MDWIIEQLMLIAEGRGDDVSASRFSLMAHDLADIDRASLTTAFERARKECRFFPQTVEIRERAKGKAEDAALIEAEVAWDWALDYMRRWWHPDIGAKPGAPEVRQRVAYALRQIGGLRSLAQMSVGNETFLRRDFIDAYRREPERERYAAQIAKALPPLVQTQVKQLADNKSATPIKPKEAPRIEEIYVARDKLFATEQRKADAAAERLEKGRIAHAKKVECLRKKGLL